eukprot:m.114214 g.114214  ORF g.114214 m.114214 type:complete len:451 (+) comp14158_c1_seq1:2006-3358(+)
MSSAGLNCPVPNLPPPPPPPIQSCTVCDKDNKNRPNQLVFEYTGPQGGFNNQQGSKAGGDSGPYPASTVISFMDKDGNSLGNSQISNGQRFGLTGGFDSETRVRLGNGVEFYFHTSCSVPIVVGDQYGPLRLVGSDSCPAGNPSPSPSPPTTPPIGSVPFCTICDSNNKNRPSSITFEYTGPFGANNNQQGDKAGGTLNGPFPPATSISFLDKDDSSLAAPVQVTSGSVFTITASFDSETNVRLGNGQSFYFHTSCSVPLRAGDQFGPIRVLGGGACLPPTGPSPPSPVPPFNPPSPVPPPIQSCTICDRDNKNRPSSLSIEYTGPFGANNNNQGSKAGGTLTGSFPPSTQISFLDKDGSTLSTQQVSSGQIFTVNGPFDSETNVVLSTGQNFYFHTSCSVELSVGDQFGPIRIVGGGNCQFNSCGPFGCCPGAGNIPKTGDFYPVSMNN